MSLLSLKLRASKSQPTTSTSTPSTSSTPSSQRRYAFWKPGTAGPGISETHSLSRSTLPRSLPTLPYTSVSTTLPVDAMEEQVVYAVETHDVVLVVGETGCGKSTRIPLFLSSRYPRVVVSLPSVLGVVALAAEVGKTAPVGYHVPFDAKYSPHDDDPLLFVSGDMLLRRLLANPLLLGVDVVVIDEAHDASLATEIALGLISQAQRTRARDPTATNLKIVVVSATLQTKQLLSFFTANNGGKEHVSVGLLPIPGRSYPVNIVYLATPVVDYLSTIIDLIVWIHTRKPRGDILVFCTGIPEIALLHAKLDRLDSLHGLSIARLHAQLSPYALRNLIKPEAHASGRRRRVVLASDVAQTAITLPNVGYVIDPGFVMRSSCVPPSSTISHSVKPVSRAEAAQRAGRAGRTQAGTVFRLYTEKTYRALDRHPPPALQSSPLESLVLLLKYLRVPSVAKFPLPFPPQEELLRSALADLRSLGALTPGDTGLTKDVGHFMASVPLSARAAAALLASVQAGCGLEMCILVSMLSVKSVFVEHSKALPAVRSGQLALGAAEGDHLTLINIFVAYRGIPESDRLSWAKQFGLSLPSLHRAVLVFHKLTQLVATHGMTLKSVWALLHGPGSGRVTRKQQTEVGSQILQAYTMGFASHAAVHAGGDVYTSLQDGSLLTLHPLSILSFTEHRPPIIIYHDTHQVADTSIEAKASASASTAYITYIREVSGVLPQWLNTAHAASSTTTHSAPTPASIHAASVSLPAPMSAPMPAPISTPASPPPPPVLPPPRQQRVLTSKSTRPTKRQKRRKTSRL